MVVRLKVQPFLAEYARRRFERDELTGALLIPRSFDLWHCLWQVMQKPPRGGRVTVADANLAVRLPWRRRQEGEVGKDPAYWNYISPEGQRQVEQQLRRLYYYDLHQWMLHPRQGRHLQRDLIRQFMQRWGTNLDHEDALLKNWQRYRKNIAFNKV